MTGKRICSRSENNEEYDKILIVLRIPIDPTAMYITVHLEVSSLRRALWRRGYHRTGIYQLKQ